MKRKTKAKGALKAKVKATAKETLRRMVGTVMPVSYKRKFDGETYTLEELELGHVKATALAAKIRKQGYKARVVKTKLYKWAVYINWKK